MVTKPDPFNPPEFQDKRVTPPGIMPKNMQARVVAGVSAVMIAVMAFSAMRSPKERVASSSPAQAVDPNAAHIEEYQKQVEEQTRKLKLEQAALLAKKEDLPVVREVASPSPVPPRSTGKILSKPVAAEQRPKPRPVESDKDKRDESLFASNIALSYRNQVATPSETSPAAQKKPARTDPVAAPSEKKSQGKSEQQETLPSGRQEYPLLEGTVIETVLTNRLEGSFSGPVNSMVTTDVYSSEGQHLLIPQGSRVLGEVHKVDTFGQQRLTVTFHRLIMPNGYSVTLDKFQGLDQIGEMGLQDQVNHHYLQVFGVSIALGAIAGLGEANVGTTTAVTGTAGYEQGVAGSLSQSSMRILDRYLNVVPTLTIHEGNRIKIYLSADLKLPQYDGGRDFQ